VKSIEEEKADVEIEMTAHGMGQVRINGVVIPRTTCVSVESECGKAPLVLIRVWPTSVKYTVAEFDVVA